MKRLYHACGKLAELMAVSGKLDKQDIITKYKDDDDFMSLILCRLNPFLNYKMKKIPDIVSNTKADLGYDEFVELLDTLAESNINNSLRNKAIKILERADYRYLHILIGLVTKSLSLGIDTGVNKALGYKFIPTFNVMLAVGLKDGMDIPIPCQIDVKYDGVRDLAIIEDGKCTLYTRKGRVLHFPKLEEEFLILARKQDFTFDTELEMEARTGISGVCNSNLKTGYVQGSDDLIKCTVFDVLPTSVFLAEGISDIQSERTLTLQKMFAVVEGKMDRVQLAKSQTIHSIDKLMEIANRYISEGLEGIIAKDPNAVYQFRRNKAWLKVKAINSTTLKIIDTEEGKGKRKGKVGALVCESSDGKILVKVGSGLTDEMVDLFTETPPIGKYAEVLFNVLIKSKKSEVYSLFLPRLKPGEGIRIDKDEADSLQKVLDDHIGKPEI